MDETEHNNIRLYLEAAFEAVENSYFNLHGAVYGVAVSRAYYAFFYAASAMLLTKGIVRGKHSAVIAAFRQYFVKPGLVDTQFSDAFGKAFNLRHEVDYDLVVKADQKTAETTLEAAKAFVEFVDAYLHSEGLL